ncbi:histone acetyltransferase GCN5 [Heliocybe sulcata]|uniref:histone acetyltransferase n=1 Tax=Heliocybe sulcata TaxID=5364 RepID=A0A5C3NA29_9AGAM|nr:histone acetyltransferase GCN5 [Heliocybe sulcata]
MNDQVSGANGHDSKIKVEDTIDETQLNRLATGVPVDTAKSGSTALKSEKLAHCELRKRLIRVEPVENNGSPRSWILLTQLKTLFQKQLPKMPREYIARLVYDQNSRCMGIIKRGLKVVGGICFRPFPHRGFAEIVFFATNSFDQVKGYGGMLMDHFKAHIRRTYPNMMYFLTYADNYAVGYFRKQGFSKEITLPRSVWAGYIKDYEGGTIMQCTMLRKVDYLRTKEIIGKQLEAVKTKMAEKSKDSVIYTGLQWPEGNGDEIQPLDPQDVPGLMSSQLPRGWLNIYTTRPVVPWGKVTQYSKMRKLMEVLQGHKDAFIFEKPVDTKIVTDYLDVIQHPMDFGTMDRKLSNNQYSSMDVFLADAQLVFDNCRFYNGPTSSYHRMADDIEAMMREWLAENGAAD